MRNELAAYNERLAGRPGNEARVRPQDYHNDVHIDFVIQHSLFFHL